MKNKIGAFTKRLGKTRNKDEQREAQRRSPEKEGKTSEVEPEENQEIEEAKKRLGR